MTQALSDIMAALATLETAINPPPGTAATLVNVTNEPQDTLDVFPTIVNWETRTDVAAGRGTPTFGTTVPQEYTHYVTSVLVLAPADAKYAYRLKRQWFEPVIDAFRQNPTLSGVCGGVYVDAIDHSAARLQGGIEYPGFTMHLHILAAG